MLAKELIVGRWRIILCMLVVAAEAIFKTLGVLDNPRWRADLVRDLVQNGAEMWLLNHDSTIMLSVVAALLGSDLIGGEVGKGTIGFLLSRPISRERILLSKYLSSAVALLGVTLLSGAIPCIIFRLGDFVPPVAEVLRGALYLWCMELSILALALAFSAVSKDAIVPFLFTLVGFFLFIILDFQLGFSITDDDDISFVPDVIRAGWYALRLTMTGLLLGVALLLFRRRAF